MLYLILCLPDFDFRFAWAIRSEREMRLRFPRRVGSSKKPERLQPRQRQIRQGMLWVPGS
jgi:hypothetical protein